MTLLYLMLGCSIAVFLHCVFLIVYSWTTKKRILCAIIIILTFVGSCVLTGLIVSGNSSNETQINLED